MLTHEQFRGIPCLVKVIAIRSRASFAESEHGLRYFISSVQLDMHIKEFVQKMESLRTSSAFKIMIIGSGMACKAISIVKDDAIAYFKGASCPEMGAVR